MHSNRYRAALAPLIVSFLTACFGDAVASEHHSTTEERVPIVVRAATPVTRHITVTASGTVEPYATADVAFQVPGLLATVAVDEGDQVVAGQVLASLDRTDYALARDQASLASRRASDEARRARALSTTNSIAPNDLERAVNTEAQADVAVAMAEKRLRDTRLASPLSGTVARRQVDRGETISAGAPAFTIVNLDTVRARVAVPESDVGFISRRATATLTVPSLGDTAFSGRVRLVGIAADNVTRTYAVEISVPNPGHRLKAGMIVESAIETPRESTRLLVPASAIVRDAEGATQLFVYAATEQRVHARRVTPGAMTGSDVEITSGLTEGELVVVGGQHRLREGVAARPTTPNAHGVALGSRP